MSELRLATVTSLTGGVITIADDLDASTDLVVDVFIPFNFPTVGDRVLYQVLADGRVAVLASITNPTRMYAVTLTMGGTANTTDTQHVTYPTGWFPAAPRVFGTVGTGTASAGTTNTEIWTANLTATGFDANFNRSNTTTCTVRWLAVLL